MGPMCLTSNTELDILNLEKNTENFQNLSLLFRASEATLYRCGVVGGGGRGAATLWYK